MTMALLYCRAETGTSPDYSVSLEMQERILVDDARHRGFEYVVIREAAPAAGETSRDRLAEALDLLDEHHADVLMAVRLDRLEDSTRDPAFVFERAAARGWGLIVAGETIGPGAISPRFQEHLDELAASRLRSLRTREGIQRRRLEGGDFGRVVSNAFLPTYRRVLSMHGDGIGMNEIARRLNSEGVSTARGGTWHASTVRAILMSDTAKKLA